MHTYDRTCWLIECDVFGQFCFTSAFISEDDFPHDLIIGIITVALADVLVCAESAKAIAVTYLIAQVL